MCDGRRRIEQREVSGADGLYRVNPPHYCTHSTGTHKFNRGIWAWGDFYRFGKMKGTRWWLAYLYPAVGWNIL